MSDRPDEQHLREDRCLDQNLRMAARTIELPAKASDAQRAAWKGGALAAAINQRFDGDESAAVLRMDGAANSRTARLRRRKAWFAGFGSAAAAVIAFVALLLVPNGQTTVQAGTILASFRERLGSSLRLTFENVGAEGIRANGALLVVLPDEEQEKGRQPRDAAGKDGRGGGKSDRGREGGVYLECSARADETAEPDVAGLDVDVKLALAHGNEWLYLKLNRLPEEVLKEGPAVAIIQQLTRNGLLLELDGLLDGDLFEQLGLKEAIEDLMAGLDPELQAEARDELDSAAPGAKAYEDAHDIAHEVARDIKIGMETHRKAAGPEKTEAVVQLGAPGQLNEEEISRMIESLFTGKATAADLQQLVTLIEQASGDVSVQKTADGAYELVARDFKVDDMDAQEAAMVARLVFRIRYREAVGVEWAALEHVGEYDGRIMFTLGETSTADPLFDRRRVIEPGITPVFNLGQLAGTLKPLISQEVQAATSTAGQDEEQGQRENR